MDFTIDGSLYKSLQAFARAQQVTPFTLLLAVFRAVHYRLTGVEDATVGTPAANRDRAELEDMIGFFVNTQCMRIVVRDDDSFNTLVPRVRSTTAAAFENQDVPFERIVSALLPGSRDTSRNPLVQLMFAVHPQKDLGKIQLESLDSETLPIAAQTRFDLEFHVFQEDTQLSGKILFSTDLFEPETHPQHERPFSRRSCIVDSTEPDKPIAVLLLTDSMAAVRNMGLLDIKKPDYPRDSSLVDVFREQVALSPDATAVVDSSSRLSYSSARSSV